MGWSCHDVPFLCYHFIINLFYLLAHTIKICPNVSRSIFSFKESFFWILDKLNFYAGYADMAIEGGGKLKYLYPLMLSFIALLHWNMDREDERLYTVCFLALPFPFIFPPHTGMRIGNYFFVCICFLIPHIFQNSSYKKRLLLSAITTMVFFTYLFVSVRYIPYTFYWNK